VTVGVAVGVGVGVSVAPGVADSFGSAVSVGVGVAFFSSLEDVLECLPPKNVVRRSPLDTESPKIASSDAVTTAAAHRNAISPVAMPSFH